MKGGECYLGRSCARYYISCHGCYFPDYKITLDPSITLDFFSYEDECLKYNNKYISTFCSQSQYKRVKGYTPAFSIQKKYYQMRFMGEKQEGYNFISIYCCNTNSYVYKFYDIETDKLNADLYLNNVIDLITLHNKTYLGLKKINLSILTCNNNCYKDINNNTLIVGLNNPKHIPLSILKGKNLSRVSPSSLKASRNTTRGKRRILNSLPELPILTHRFKEGDRVLIKNWETLGPMDKLSYNMKYKKKDILLESPISASEWKVTGISEPIDERNLYYYSPIIIGDNVMFNKELYLVIDERKTHTTSVNRIRHYETEEEIEVPHELLIKCYF